LSGRFLTQTEICRSWTGSDTRSGRYSRDRRKSLKSHLWSKKSIMNKMHSKTVDFASRCRHLANRTAYV